MCSRTRYYYGRLCLQFAVFRGDHPHLSVAEAAPAWLRTVSVSQQSVARAALRWQFPALAGHPLPVARYRRDAARLVASLLRPDQRAALRTLATAPRDRALMGCLWTMRRAEAAALLWADIDLGAGTARIRRGKGERARVALLTHEAQAALADWYVARGTPDDATPVFPGRRGQPMTAQGLGVATRRLLRRAGLWAPGRGVAHRFRRTMATEYLRANRHDVEGLRMLLGHAEIATTLRYVFLDLEDLTPSLARVAL